MFEALKGLLKPAPAAEPIKNKEEVDKKYGYWRIRTLYSIFVGYAMFYLTRKSLTFAMPALIADLGYTKTELAFAGSMLYIAYGLSKFLSGVVADRSNSRYFMAFTLIASGLCNIAFGLSSSLFLFAIFWGLNGWFQGGGYPPCAKTLTHWYSQNERGKWWSIWNTSVNFGGFIIPLLAGGIAQSLGWRFAMYIPGALCIIGGLWLINRMRDTPQSIGLPSIEKWRNDYGSMKKSDNLDKELSAKEILMTYILTNPLIWVLCIANFFLYVVRTALSDWMALYLVESKGYSLLGAGGIVSWLEIGGIAGTLLAGWASDRFFRGQRAPANALFAFLIICSILIFRAIPAGFVTLDIVAVTFIGLCTYGPLMLIGMAAAELTHKKAAASASGFTGLFGYMGSFAALGPIGWICQVWGWNGVFSTVTICSMITFVLLLTLCGFGLKRKPKLKPAIA
jgi:OPA family sugar phosphate sensor protein UhpC-like MFS transporter